jgi:hypothetical protein
MELMADESLEELLDFFETYKLNLNSYWEDPGVAEITDGVLRAKVRSLAYHLKKRQLADLHDEVLQLDLSELGVIEYLETIRSHVLPEFRSALQAESMTYTRPDTELIADIESQKQLMIAVATGGPRIESVNAEYKTRRDLIARDLAERGMTDPNPFSDLWKWYGKWSSEIQGYQPRREFVADLYEDLLQILRAPVAHVHRSEPTGWERVDRSARKISIQLARAEHEEDFQAVGLLCRDALISLAQAVFDPRLHAQNGTVPSESDAGRMLEGFIGTELSGTENEAVRRHAKAALVLANALTHKRTASFRIAALCAEATQSLISIIAIVSGRRDPK